jgi:hypothetical protein
MSTPGINASRLLRGRSPRGLAAAFAVLFLAVGSAVVLFASQAPTGADQRVEAMLGRMTLDQRKST